MNVRIYVNLAKSWDTSNVFLYLQVPGTSSSSSVSILVSLLGFGLCFILLLQEGLYLAAVIYAIGMEHCWYGGKMWGGGVFCESLIKEQCLMEPVSGV